MNNLVLSRSVDRNIAESYIRKIYDLVQSGEKFPIDLDEVWMIYYKNEKSAIESMRYNKFREGIDYQILSKNFGENQLASIKGRPGVYYKLSLNCFEHLIARKVDWLFEIYRRTFHAALSGQLSGRSVQINFNSPIEAAKAVAKYANLYVETAEALELAEGEKKKALQKAEAFQMQLQIVKPKVDFAETVMVSDKLIDIGQSAKILGLPFGRNTLFSKLRDRGIFFKDRNEPKQVYVDCGYFKLKEMLVNSTGNIPDVYVKVLVTQRGLNFLRKVFWDKISQRAS